jgi:DNA/RNA-binding domain of Phe-tRNA-synthetase-like protein
VYFAHSHEIWQDFPELAAGVVFVDGITADANVAPRVSELTAVSESRLATSSEGELPEVQAWRRTFSKMGLKPTQYRSASEALLRRFRKEGALPRIHPFVDLCNAISLAFAIPVAAFDVDRIAEYVEVRYAAGDEAYVSFAGEVENPAPGEVVFADALGRAHARRWTNRQSGLSAVRERTGTVLVVAEAMHESARADVENLVDTLTRELAAVWRVEPKSSMLTAESPRFEFRRRPNQEDR